MIFNIEGITRTKICIIKVYLISIILKETSYINDAIIDKQSTINQIKYQLNNWSMS